MKKHHFYIFVILPLLAFSTLMLIFANDDKERATAITPACSNGGVITLNGTASTGGTSIAPGSHTLTFSQTGSTEAIAQVYFTFDSETNFVGRGIQKDPSTWAMKWISTVSPSGTHTIGALIKSASGTCLAPPITVNIANTTGQQPFQTVANPDKFTDYTNVTRDFILQTRVNEANNLPVDITPWAMYIKGPVSHGVVSSEHFSNTLKYFSGATPGQGYFTVRVNYGGTVIPLNVPVNVLTPPTSDSSTTNTSSSTPTNTSTTSPTTTTKTTTTATSTTEAPDSTSTTTQAKLSSPVPDSDPIVKLCLIKALTEPRYILIDSGKERPTLKEFEATRQCFAAKNYIIPVVYSPVPPSKTVVKEFPVSKIAQVASVATATVKDGAAQKPAIKFSGKASPNTLVLLYVFSEPLVLSTTSNGDGEWSYSLEDPLEPGKHEAYALVNQGDGVYERSSVFDFAIARASAASSNPDGYSFTVEANTATPTASNYTTRLYIASVIGLVVIVAGFIVFIFIRKQSHPILNSVSTTPTEPKPVYTPPQAMPDSTIITPTETPQADTTKPDSSI